MSSKSLNDQLWMREGESGISSKYYDQSDLMKKTRLRNILFISSFLLYLFVSAILILF